VLWVVHTHTEYGEVTICY